MARAIADDATAVLETRPLNNRPSRVRETGIMTNSWWIR